MPAPRHTEQLFTWFLNVAKADWKHVFCWPKPESPRCGSHLVDRLGGCFALDPRISLGVETFCTEPRCGDSIFYAILPILHPAKPILHPAKPILQVRKYSSFSRLLRVTSWVLRFVHNIRSPSLKDRGMPSSEEINAAEHYWIRNAQREAFGLQPTTHTSLRNASLFHDDEGILRMQGRLQYGVFPDAVKHPIVLPSNHPITAMIIRQTHLRLLHAGVQGTLTDLREAYWVIRGRQVVKRVVHGCRVCRRAKARACTEIAGPLPRDRVSAAAPFDVTGTDYAGPLFYRPAYEESNVSRKCYILIFTCAVTRAVHLELTESMTAEDFLKAFKRFVSRRGVPGTVYSDNFRTFKSVSRELSVGQLSQDPDVNGFLTVHRINWKFIVERAAWWGGFWERLIKSAKVCLRKILGKSTLTYSELATVVTEVEAVLNSRPLTYVSEDPDDLSVLTPGHFLVGKRISALPYEPVAEVRSTSNQLRRRWKYRERLMESFWTRWTKEYILYLRSANIRKPLSSCSVKTGDIVLIAKENAPRVSWPLGRVESTRESADGRIRSCQVRISGGKIICRPIQLLHKLEADED
ncbi:uncharacterized protein LOC135384694 [Ornithodoros turicata]|uniref:uncharacterized protein LOC135384694 n=1 Tax=Ornithodoros turicata TaxID=34597 RepID=UPI00313A380C